jgi:uncharacterized protein DUF5753
MMTMALDEALMRRPVGGPAVMTGQLRFLADMAAQPNVCLRVVPYAAGLHPGLATGAFTVLHFPPSKRDSDTAIVYASGLTDELYLDKPHEVQRYREAHAGILGCALDRAATQDLLFTAAKDLERQAAALPRPSSTGAAFSRGGDNLLIFELISPVFLAKSRLGTPSAEKPNTRSPTATSATPSPSSSTTPAASWPRVCGSSPSIRPLRFFQSLGLTPAARTAIRTWPRPGCGSGRSTISRTSGPPN